MITLEFSGGKLKIRREPFGCTVFDGKRTIQANEVFCDILIAVGENRDTDSICRQLLEDYDGADASQMTQDIESVKDYCRERGWI